MHACSGEKYSSLEDYNIIFIAVSEMLYIIHFKKMLFSTLLMYESSKSVVLLKGEKSDMFTIEQGVAWPRVVHSLSPIYFQYSVMIC